MRGIPSIMRVRYRQLDPDLPPPAYQTPGAVGLDLYARVPAGGVLIPPGGMAVIPCNVIVEVPDGYAALLFARSSLPLRTGLMVANGVGVVDQDYCGPDDEVGCVAYNPTPAPVRVERGQRLAQLVFAAIARAELERVERIDRQTRGGFGSTA